MITVDRRRIRAALEKVFALALDVERWPALLPHYRWVRFRERRGEGGLVEMAAWRPFGLLDWPTWWLSEMVVERAGPRITYRHVRGITSGMDVAWDFSPEQDAVLVTVSHWWDGPRWPLIGRAAADVLIGPVFVHGIASRTLGGLARAAEAR